MKRFIECNKREYIFCLVTTFVWGLIAHAYGFLNAAPSHDWLNALCADKVEESVKIASGRFFVPVYRALVRNAVAQPWLIGLIGLLFLSVAVFFVVKLFDVSSKKITVLIAGVMVTNITLTAQIATYLHEFDFNMLALALSVAAAYLWHKNESFWGHLCACVLLVISVSIYQSYIAVCITLVMIVSIIALLEGEATKKTVLKGLRAVGMILCALVLYFVIGKIVYLFADIPQQERIDVFDLSGISNVPLFYAKLFLQMYIHFGSSLVDFKVYPLALIVSLVALMLLVIGFTVIYSFIKNKEMTVGQRITVLLLALLLPFGMNVTFILTKGEGVHDLMIYAVWLTYIILLVTSHRFSESLKVAFKGKRVLAIVACVIVAVFVWQNVLLSNTAYLKKEMNAESTLSMMTRVVADMEEREDYEAGKTKVAFVGITETQSPYDEFGGACEITGVGSMNSPISQDIYKSTCNLYREYFKYVLNYPVNMCEDEVHEALKESDEVMDMPCYPREGYIQMVDGVLVVRMGELWYSKGN